MGCIVDENVDAAEFPNGRFDDPAAMVGRLDVAGGKHGLATCFLHQSLGGHRVVMLAQIADKDVRSLARIGDRHGPADAAVPAGDDGSLVLQASGTLVGVFPVIGQRLHPIGSAGHFLGLAGKGRVRKFFHGHELLRKAPSGMAIGIAGLPPASTRP